MTICKWFGLIQIIFPQQIAETGMQGNQHKLFICVIYDRVRKDIHFSELHVFFFFLQSGTVIGGHCFWVEYNNSIESAFYSPLSLPLGQTLCSKLRSAEKHDFVVRKWQKVPEKLLFQKLHLFHGMGEELQATAVRVRDRGQGQGQGQEPGQEQGHGSRRTDGGDHCFKHFCWKRASWLVVANGAALGQNLSTRSMNWQRSYFFWPASSFLPSTRGRYGSGQSGTDLN